MRDDNGNNAAYTEPQVHAIIAGMNRIYRQPAMTFELELPINYTNRTEWLNLRRIDNYCPEANAMLRGLSKNATPGLKLCMVNTITSFTTATGQTSTIGGSNYPNGILLATGYPALPLSPKIAGHEVGHACRLRDIYVSRPAATPLTVTGPASKVRMPFDWGSGYYPPDLAQADLIKHLLMFGVSDGPATDNAIDIPKGPIYGLWYTTNQNHEVIWKLNENEPAPVGLEDLERQPNHR